MHSSSNKENIYHKTAYYNSISPNYEFEQTQHEEYDSNQLDIIQTIHKLSQFVEKDQKIQESVYSGKKETNTKKLSTILTQKDSNSLFSQNSKDYSNYSPTSRSISSINPGSSTSTKETRSIQEFNKTVERIYQRDAKLKSRLNRLEREKEQQLKEQIQAKPQISQKSRQLAKSQFQSPLYQRASSIVQNQEKSREALKNKFLEEKKIQEKSELIFKPQLLQSSCTSTRSRSIQEFNEDMKSWNQQKEYNLLKMKNQFLQTQQLQNSFKPQISQKSKDLTLNRSFKDLLLEDDQAAEQNKFKYLPKEDLSPSFKPKICKKSHEIVLKKQRVSQQTKSPQNQQNNTDKVRELPSTNNQAQSKSHSLKKQNNLNANSSINKININEKKSNKSQIQQINYTPDLDGLIKRLGNFY